MCSPLVDIPRMAVLFDTPLTMCGSYSCPISLPALGIACLFHFRYCIGYRVLSHSGFNLNLSDD